MLGECCASNRTIPSDDVDDAWGNASLERQLAHAQRAQRGLLCHLAMQYSDETQLSVCMGHALSSRDLNSVDNMR